MTMETRLLLAALIVVMAAAIGCGRSEEAPAPAATPSTPAATPTPVNPRVLLEESGRVMEAVVSFHFRMDHPVGGTPFLLNLLVEEVEGDVVNPDKMSIGFNGTFGVFAIRSRLITLGDTVYMTNPLTDEWEQVAAEVSPLAFFDPGRGIASIMSEIGDLVLVDTGDESYGLKGSVPAEALVSLVGETVTGTAVEVELTIDSRDLYLLKAVFKGRVTPLEPEGTFRVITLSNFGEPVIIEPPQ